MSQLGTQLLWLTTLVCLWTFGTALIAGLSSDRERRGRLMASAHTGAYLTFGLLLFVCVALGYAFYVDDFSIKYVANHSSKDLPRAYAVTALWSGMEGSLTFWATILGGYLAAVVYFNRATNRTLMPWVIVTLAGTLAFFMGVQILLADPFAAMPFPIPVDGRGLNPQLQNPGMVIHPPMLYLGYVGCAVPFAFAMAALITGKLDDGWILSTRRWLLTAWAFLSVGILLGGVWAYVELGWGGYWAWDPVENASFLPWLAATAYLHSVMIQEKRGMLKVWNMLLVFQTFFLSILGTFLTRSGVVQSVHVFAQSDIGWYFLGFLITVLVFFLVFFLPRLSVLKSDRTFDSLLSREAAFLFQNWLFVLFIFVVLLGTLGEPLSKWINGVATTFRSPYFNSLAIPLGLGILLLTGIGPLIAWRKATARNTKRMFFIPSMVGLTTGAVVAAVGVAMGFLDLSRGDHLLSLLTFSLSGFVVGTIVMEFVKGVSARRRTAGGGVLQALLRLVLRNRRRYGGYVVHFGMVLIFSGIAGTAFNAEGQAALKVGEAMAIENYVLHYTRAEDATEPNSWGVRTRIDVFQEGEYLGAWGPEKRFFYREEQAISEIAIRAGLWEDLYMVVASFDQDDASVILKVHVNPLVSWIWLGGLILALGTLLGMWPSREEMRVWVTDYTVADGTEGVAAARG